MSFIPAEFIKKKRGGGSHSPEELSFFIHQFLEGTFTDYQMSAWLMAVFFQGASSEEISTLTQVMKDSGATLNFPASSKRYVDKHSTGGIGDKTSLIITPIVAASGVCVPMIAGRGLGHTGGTLDKLESLPGFRTQLTKKDIEAQVSKIHGAIVGPTEDICPADRKLYRLRDVTATVESLPLICASIMSKKLAENLNALVLDVKFGSGAFMKTFEEAKKLAQLLIHTGQSHGVQTVALLTDMNQPLGRYLGNALEVKECLDILKGQSCMDQGIDFYKDTKELSLYLSGHMIHMGGQASSFKEGLKKASDILFSGKAYEKFKELCEHQGPTQIDQLSFTEKIYDVTSSEEGYVNHIDAEGLGWVAVDIGAGRKSIEDPIDPSAGIEWCCKIGQKIEKGQVLAKVYCKDSQKAQRALQSIPKTITLGPLCSVPPLIVETLYGAK